MTILELKKISKTYGEKKVLTQLDLSVPTGSIYGFVGENGAGKTTTMKIILGLEEASSGEVLIDGERIVFGQANTNQITGYLPDVPEFYDYMTAYEYLLLCGELTGLQKQQLPKKADEMLHLVGLERSKQRIRGFSRGMRQRLGIAQALLNEPRLLICDEPTSALDPGGRNEFLTLLASLRNRVTILFSTHILADVERICDYVGILDGGQLVFNGSLDDIKKQNAATQAELIFEDITDWHTLEEKLLSLKEKNILTDVRRTSEKRLLLSYALDYSVAMNHVLQLLLLEKQIPVTMRKIEPSLESIFLEVTTC